MSKQFIATVDGDRVAGPCPLEEIRVELGGLRLGDDLDRAVVHELVPTYAVQAISIKLTPIRPRKPSKPAKKGR